LISYELRSRVPFEVEECSPTTGAACGAIYLDAGYEALIRRKLGSHADNLLTPKRLNEILQFFDAFMKPAFNPIRGINDFAVLLPGPDIHSIGLKDGYLMITKYTLSSTELTE
jgi:hypothetical protein